MPDVAITAVVNSHKKHNKNKEAFIKIILNECPKGWSVVVCRVKHTARGPPHRKHVELSAPAETAGFDIHWVRNTLPSGFTFTKHGDGGFINWGFKGKFERSGDTLVHRRHH